MWIDEEDEKQLDDFSGCDRPPDLQQLVVINQQGAGDLVVLSGRLRDLKIRYPEIDLAVMTGRKEIFQHSKYFKLFNDEYINARIIKCEVYPEEYGNEQPHFAHVFHRKLERQLKREFPLQQLAGHVELTPEETAAAPISGRYWLFFAGGKKDFQTKLWPQQYYQWVADELKLYGIQTVQVGSDLDEHPPLKDVINRLGHLSYRELFQLIYYSDGVLTPISFGMHAAAAVPCSPEKRFWRRPCVVIAGGREAVGFVNYPGHRVLSNIGSLPCCRNGACWKYKTKPWEEDGRWFEPDCEMPEGGIARCMQIIQPPDVISAILSYYSDRDL